MKYVNIRRIKTLINILTVKYYSHEVTKKNTSYVIDVHTPSTSPNRLITRNVKHEFIAKTLERAFRSNPLQIYTFFIANVFYKQKYGGKIK